MPRLSFSVRKSQLHIGQIRYTHLANKHCSKKKMWPFRKKKSSRKSISHPTLGTVSEPASPAGGYEATILSEDTPLKIWIDPDDKSIEEALAFASSVAAELKTVVGEAMRIAVRDLRPMYNEGWNEYDEKQPDGTTRAVQNPELSESDFKKKLTLESISITGTECIEIWLKNSNLFWGHGTFVSCLNGLDFSEARAEIFG